MTTAKPAFPSAHYELKSELARVCLPGTHADANAQRRLAWINSVCLLFLMIGVVGLRATPPAPIALKPLEEPIAAILEPLPPPPPATTQEQTPDDQNPQDAAQAPRVVVVTLETPAIHFSVPTIGTVVAPLSLAQAPPARSEQAAVQQSVPKPKTRLINSTGEGGDRPTPEYPELAQSLGQRGVVTLLFTVDDVGKVTSIQVKRSSGSSILDRGALAWVKKHWIVPPGEGGRVYEATINYTL